MSLSFLHCVRSRRRPPRHVARKLELRGGRSSTLTNSGTKSPDSQESLRSAAGSERVVAGEATSRHVELTGVNA
jgi:hypothetical protein